MAILTVVGERLRDDPALAARIVAALTGFPLRMVSQAASRRNVTIVLREAIVAPAMTHLHTRGSRRQPSGSTGRGGGGDRR